MKAISIKTWSHLASSVGKRNDLSSIRESDAQSVSSFPELVSAVAAIAFHNPRFSLFFRGQDEDYRDHKGHSSIYPEIYRRLKDGPSGSPSSDLRTRFADLKRASELILPRIIDIDDGRGIQQMARFPEVGWAVLQHYDVCPTPLVDITQSLRVAASFAKPTNSNKDGVVFVLGLPHINGSITYSVEDELLYIKLLSIAPPAAKRPHYQEGYLLGSFPSSKTYASAEYDVARRLIAKFRIHGSRFWTSDFPPIPQAALYPENDPFRTAAEAVRDDLSIPEKPRMILQEE